MEDAPAIRGWARALAALGLLFGVPAAADSLRILTVAPSEVLATSPFDIEVVLLDSSGRPRPGEFVTFNAPGVRSGATVEFYEGSFPLTDDLGRARYRLRAGMCPGIAAFTAQANGATARGEVLVQPKPGVAVSVTVLSGGGQRTRPDTFFAEPISVRVQDAFGAVVRDAPVVFANGPDYMLNWYDDSSPYLGGILARSEADGVATGSPPRLYWGAQPGDTAEVVVRNLPDCGNGASIWLVAEGKRPSRYEVVSGGFQEALVGTQVPHRFVMRTLDEDGVIVPRALVAWWSTGPYEDRWGNAPYNLSFTVSDAMGIATSSTYTLSKDPGLRYVSRGASGPSFGVLGVRRLTPTAEAPNVQDLWWAGPAENGWGLSIAQRGESLFPVIFAYDGSGAPTWFVVPAGEWNADRTVFSGDAYQPRGSPFFAYDSSRFMAGNSVGTIELTFTDSGNASLDYTIHGAKGSKRIRRQPIAVGGATNELYWGGIQQNGWGLSVARQGDALFSTWFTYDATGTPVWFAMPSGTWTSASTYEGRIYRTTGSPWVGTDYDAAALEVRDVGSFRLRFEGEAATFEYEVEGHRGNLPLARQPF